MVARDAGRLFQVGQVRHQQLVLRWVARIAASDDGRLPGQVELEQLAVLLQVHPLEVLAQPRARAASDGLLRAGRESDARADQYRALGHTGLIELGRLRQRLARVVEM